MKHVRRLLLAVCTLVILGIPAQKTHARQTSPGEGQLAISAGLSYGFDIEEIGLRAGATYFLGEEMRIGGDLTYWLVDTQPGVSATYLEFNANFHYIFFSENALMIYGVGALGLHYASVSVDIPGVGTVSDSDSELGLGLGAGLEYNLGGVSLFAEPKLFLSGFDQFKFNFGIRYYL